MKSLNRLRLVMLLIALTAVTGGANVWTVNAQVEDTAANSQFSTTTEGATTTNFLLDGFDLGSVAGPGPKKTIDVFVDRAVGGNPFKPFGAWTKTF